MHSSNMMTGILVVGAIIPSTEVPHQSQYNTANYQARGNRKSVPIRISVKKHDK